MLSRTPGPGGNKWAGRLVAPSMRKPTQPEAHRGRVALLEGRFPEGMKTRCSWCREIREVQEGSFVSVTEGRGGAETRFFKCDKCGGGKSQTAA